MQVKHDTLHSLFGATVMAHNLNCSICTDSREIFPKVKYYAAFSSVHRVHKVMRAFLDSDPSDFCDFNHLYCLEQLSKFILVNLVWCKSDKLHMSEDFQQKIAELQQGITKPRYPVGYLSARLKKCINTLSTVQKIKQRRLSTLKETATVKIQRAWRAHAYNPDRSQFGIKWARREFDQCKELIA